MIYIFEKLTPENKRVLLKHEPFMDFQFSINNRSYYWQTSCAGFEIRNGKYTEIRKARFYSFAQLKEGFICDDIGEARWLSPLAGKEIEDFKENSDKYNGLMDYIRTCILAAEVLSTIAVPVRAFCKHFSEVSPSQLDILDLKSLNEWDINILDYIERKDGANNQL